MTRIGKNHEGAVMYLSDEELIAMKNGKLAITGTNQQKAKIRKILNRM
jgi:hypothetical protein